MKQITVYGPGCKRCAATESMIREAAGRLGIEVAIDKVTDLAAIARAGVISTPGVAVEGRLVHTGGLPDPARIEGWLRA
jgi:small redox-active disulfide protein 2